MFKITENKNDGWHFTEELTFSKDIYKHDAILFNKALLSLFSDSEKFKRFEKGSLNERKGIIYECLLNELESIKDNLKYDLEHNIKIYPLIKKEVNQ